MWNRPNLGDLLWEAYFGPRAWFVGCVLFGAAVTGGSWVFAGTPPPHAVALTSFIALFIAAVMGSTSLSFYRVRHSYGSVNEVAWRVFIAALLWNTLLGASALIIDRVILYFGLLHREPLAFPASLGLMATFAAMTLLSVYPRNGPQ